MSNSKTKSRSMTLVGATVDPRVRMKEVRAMVKLAHKQNLRVDLIQFEGDDVARSQIALQDMLAKEQEKHAKARNMIVEQKEIMNQLVIVQMMFMEENQRLDKNTRSSRESVSNLEDALTEADDLNDQMREDLESTMNSLRVALNGQINGEA